MSPEDIAEEELHPYFQLIAPKSPRSFENAAGGIRTADSSDKNNCKEAIR